MTKQALTQWRRENLVAYAKELPDGRLMGVTRQIYTCLLWIGTTESWSAGWEYPTMPQALAAAVYFLGDGDPMDGWVRHLSAGSPTRRRPDGDPAREYVEDGTHLPDTSAGPPPPQHEGAP